MQRYDINSCSEDCDPVTFMKDGDYILYADHLATLEAAVKERDNKIKELEGNLFDEDEQIVALEAALKDEKDVIRKISQLICGNDIFPGDLTQYVKNEIDGRRLAEEQIAALTEQRTHEIDAKNKTIRRIQGERDALKISLLGEKGSR